MMSQGHPVTHIVLPSSLRQRMVIDKLAKLVSKQGLEAEKEVRDLVVRGRCKD